MAKRLYEMQAELCKTLSNPKRLEILDILKEEGEISFNSLAEKLEIPKANTSQHLAVLRQAGVVITRRDGINVYYRLHSPKISEAPPATSRTRRNRRCLSEGERLLSFAGIVRKNTENQSRCP